MFLLCRFLLTLTHWLGTDGCSDVVGIQGIVRHWAGNHDSFGLACGLPCTYLLWLVFLSRCITRCNKAKVGKETES